MSDSEFSENEEMESSEFSENEEMETEVGTNQGLANVMAKILAKSAPKRVILAKSKTERELNKAKKQKLSEATNEEEGKEGDGTVSFTKKRKKADEEESSSEDEDPEAKRERQQKKRLWEYANHVKPDVLDKEREKNLQRIATKGVVQLFNAVKKQQKIVSEKVEEAGPTSRKKERAMQAVSKGHFMDVLRGSVPNVVSEGVAERTVKTPKTEASEGNPTWGILKDSFMMGAKMKDWDKESASEDNVSDHMSNDSDGD